MTWEAEITPTRFAEAIAILAWRSGCAPTRRWTLLGLIIPELGHRKVGRWKGVYSYEIGRQFRLLYSVRASGSRNTPSCSWTSALMESIARQGFIAPPPAITSACWDGGRRSRTTLKAYSLRMGDSVLVSNRTCVVAVAAVDQAGRATWAARRTRGALGSANGRPEFRWVKRRVVTRDSRTQQFQAQAKGEVPILVQSRRLHCSAHSLFPVGRWRR